MRVSEFNGKKRMGQAAAAKQTIDLGLTTVNSILDISKSMIAIVDAKKKNKKDSLASLTKATRLMITLIEPYLGDEFIFTYMINNDPTKKVM
jgi:hypothetical protein